MIGKNKLEVPNDGMHKMEPEGRSSVANLKGEICKSVAK